ncbi:MAG: hypothetical protein MSC30_05300 [Gaiellaceae bacterium MAG52_C11]|nr:hypothetical protein [Candidatus Gaiellasilicea maunaloa]
MDLRLYSRVILRFWFLLFLGIVVAFALALLSYYNVSFTGSSPKLTPRAEEVWQSQATLFLTEPGFPAGRRNLDVVPVVIGGEVVLQNAQNRPDAYTALASLYAKLAQSDEVGELMRNDGRGALTGDFSVIPAADTTYRREAPLPMLALFGKGSTPKAAEETADRGKDAFLRYLRSEQVQAGIRQNERVLAETINEPQPALLIVPRKKTLPFVVFLAVVFAAIALVFVLENMRPTGRAVANERTPLADVRRSA